MTDRVTGLRRRFMSRRSGVRRLGWGVADQAVSSLSNFLLGIYVARSLGAVSLGAFGLAFATYSVVLNASRGLSTDPLMVRYSGAPIVRWRSAVASSSAVALLVGVVSGSVCLGIGVLLDHLVNQPEIGSAFIALGLGLPGLMLQDSWRYAFFSSGQGEKAFANDAVWTVLLVAALVLGHSTGRSSVELAMLAFGGSATLAALFGLLQTRIVPRPRTAQRWLSANRDLGPRYLVENVTLGAGGQIRSFILAGASGLAAVGAVRGAEMLVGPIVVLLMGIAQVAVPESVRWLERGRRLFGRFCSILSLGLASTSLAWGAVIVVLFPWGIGELLLGPVWEAAYPLVPGVIASATAGCLMVGPSAGLRALGQAHRSLRSQLIVTTLYIVIGGAGAMIWGAPGVVWGSAIAAAAGAAVWWQQLSKGTKEHFDRLTVLPSAVSHPPAAAAPIPVGLPDAGSCPVRDELA